MGLTAGPYLPVTGTKRKKGEGVVWAGGEMSWANVGRKRARGEAAGLESFAG
jgi:hypothetical protein